LFNGVIVTHFLLNGTKRYDILKILIKYKIQSENQLRIKQPGPVSAGLVPIRAGLCQSGAVGAGAGAGTGKYLTFKYSINFHYKLSINALFK
jgi:hypothetical protein